MPKTTYLGTVPEVDKIKALILERKNALGYSRAKMAAILGVSTTTYWSMMNRPIDTWELGEIKTMCKALGIPKDTLRAVI